MFGFNGDKTPFPKPIALESNPEGFHQSGKMLAELLHSIDNCPHQFNIELNPLDEAPRRVTAHPMDADEIAVFGAAHRLNVTLFDLFGARAIYTVNSEIQPPQDGEPVVWNEAAALVVLALAVVENCTTACADWIGECAKSADIDIEEMMEAMEMLDYNSRVITMYLQSLVMLEALNGVLVGIGDDTDDVDSGMLETFRDIVSVGSDAIDMFTTETLRRAAEVNELNLMWENN